jgi:hypothetical protein
VRSKSFGTGTLSGSAELLLISRRLILTGLRESEWLVDSDALGASHGGVVQSRVSEETGVFCDSLTLGLSCLESLATPQSLESKRSAWSVKVTAGAAAGGVLVGLLCLLFALCRRHRRNDERVSVDDRFDIFDDHKTKDNATLANPLTDSEQDEDEASVEDCDESRPQFAGDDSDSYMCSYV